MEISWGIDSKSCSTSILIFLVLCLQSGFWNFRLSNEKFIRTRCSPCQPMIPSLTVTEKKCCRSNVLRGESYTWTFWHSVVWFLHPRQNPETVSPGPVAISNHNALIFNLASGNDNWKSRFHFIFLPEFILVITLKCLQELILSFFF